MLNSEKFKTADERARAFRSYCDGGAAQGAYKKCLDRRCIECALKWLDLEADKERPLPCPFCGGTDVVIQDVGGFELACQGCGFHTPSYMVLEKLTSEYQRVARAVMDAGKKEVTP